MNPDLAGLIKFHDTTDQKVLFCSFLLENNCGKYTYHIFTFHTKATTSSQQGIDWSDIGMDQWFIG